MKILTLCGSLRGRSSNRAVLRAYERLAPSELAFEHYDRTGLLPHFNPDLECSEGALPDEPAGLRRSIGEADAVLISTPEYAHGLPGSFKNALDWLVGDPAFSGKQVVILHASHGSTWALDSLREVLRTMSARILESASVLFPKGINQLDEEAILASEDIRTLLRHSIGALLEDFKDTGLPES